MLSPKVVEALLGTRFRGRQFGRGPLVWSHSTLAVLSLPYSPDNISVLQIAGSRLTLAIDGEGKVSALICLSAFPIADAHHGRKCF